MGKRPFQLRWKPAGEDYWRLAGPFEHESDRHASADRMADNFWATEIEVRDSPSDPWRSWKEMRK